MGVVLFVPELQRFFYAHAAVPAWMQNKWVASMQKIGQAEILAAILPYLSLPAYVFRRRNVIHFVDNTSAINAILNGYSKAPDSAWMVNIFHTANARIQANTWWEHVDSKANCADMPSSSISTMLPTCSTPVNSHLFSTNMHGAAQRSNGFINR